MVERSQCRYADAKFGIGQRPAGMRYALQTAGVARGLELMSHMVHLPVQIRTSAVGAGGKYPQPEPSAVQAMVVQQAGLLADGSYLS